jgi:hypothetical protein
VRLAATRRTRLATILAGLCAVLLVGGLVLGVWLRERSGDMERADKDHVDVVQAAQRFTVTWNTMDPEDAEGYVSRVDDLITDKFREEAFGGQDEEAVKLIREGGITSDAKVLVNGDGIPLVGVSTIDPNSAVVMVVADSNRTVNKQRVQRHWRWQLELVKQDGQWLVDDLSTV